MRFRLIKLHKINIVYYKLTNYHKPRFGGINVNDRSLKIKWPSKKIIVSEK